MTVEDLNKADIRYQIFISSAFRDLGDKRKDAVTAVVDSGHIPIALERFGASHKKDLEIIEKTIKESQIYIVILGHAYGTRIKRRKKSYTEQEYDIAKQNGLIILPFVMSEKLIKTKRAKLRRDIVDERDELNNEELLTKFYNKVRGEHFYKPWDESTNLEIEISKSLTQLFNDREKSLNIPPGFIKSKNVLDHEILNTISKNEFVREAVISINKFKSLEVRIDDEFVDKKVAAAKFLWQTYGNIITNNKIDLFLESGSTTVYVANEMKMELADHVKIQENGSPSIDVKTNNALVFLQFWLSAKIPCSMFPWGTPEGSFGASFGPINDLVKQAPTYPPKKLNASENKVIKQLQEVKLGLKREGGKQRLLILAISAVQLSDNPKCKSDSNLAMQYGNEIKQCKGFHVGSYFNKIFKLFLYSLDLPSIVCLHEDKIDSEIKIGHCHFLFESTEWDSFLHNKPLAFCIGCSNKNLDALSKRFEDLGFEIDKCKSLIEPTAFIAKNQKFIDTFEGIQSN